MQIAPFMEHYRIVAGRLGTPPGTQHGGAFERVPGPSGRRLFIIADDGETTGWEHVSVSTEKHIPNWEEMCWVKDRFWDGEDTVIQFHPPKSSYVNCHPKCLHLWRAVVGTFPLPPPILVGPMGETNDRDRQEPEYR